MTISLLMPQRYECESGSTMSRSHPIQMTGVMPTPVTYPFFPPTGLAGTVHEDSCDDAPNSGHQETVAVPHRCPCPPKGIGKVLMLLSGADLSTNCIETADTKSAIRPTMER